MIVVTVARKPCAESTVALSMLASGTGALNINASRVGTSGGSDTPSGMDRFNAANATQGYRPSAYAQGTPDAPPVGGRWPANLVLEHRCECRRVGEKQVKGSHDTTGVWGRTGGVYDGCWAHVTKNERVKFHTAPDGTETVASWDCAPDCPVAALDDQSGELPSQQVRTNPDAIDSPGMGLFGPIRKRGAEHFNEKGGASRFFKQVGGSRVR